MTGGVLIVVQWEQLDYKPEGEWQQKVKETSPNIEVDVTTLEVRRLQKEVEKLTEIVTSCKIFWRFCNPDFRLTSTVSGYNGE